MRKIQLNKIKGLEHLKDYYYIQEDGKLFGYKGREMANPLNNHGYVQNELSTEIGKKSFKRHRLVALAFIDNLDNKDQVNHIDEDKTNNHVSNLEWATPKENSQHGTRNQRIGATLSRPVIGTCVKTGKRVEFPSMAEAGRQGFHHGHISSCCNGKLNAHKGRTWKLKENS